MTYDEICQEVWKKQHELWGQYRIRPNRVYLHDATIYYLIKKHEFHHGILNMSNEGMTMFGMKVIKTLDEKIRVGIELD